MGATQKAVYQAAKELTQHQLTTGIVTKLNTYQITPIAKLVLLYLTTCYNPKHADVFPKQKTIAEKLGISERSVTRAIQELCKEGLVLVECKYSNRYKFTSKILCSDKMAADSGQNDIQQGDNLALPYIEQKRKTNKQQTVELNKSIKNTSNSGGNVYSEEDSILREYARKHGARNIDAYVNTLKKTKSAEKIIKEKRKIVTNAMASLLETQKQIELYKSFKYDSVMPETCAAWVELGKKFNFKR